MVITDEMEEQCSFPGTKNKGKGKYLKLAILEITLKAPPLRLWPLFIKRSGNVQVELQQLELQRNDNMGIPQKKEHFQK